MYVSTKIYLMTELSEFFSQLSLDILADKPFN